MRYAPWPGAVLPLTFIAAFVLYGACLHRARGASPRRTAPRLGVILATAGLVAAVNFALYPRADALKLHGRGSDEDDALIQTAVRLTTAQRPLYVPTYLGNAPSVGPGWAAFVSPLAVTGGYALLTPIALAVLAWTARSPGGGRGAALALLLPLTSVGFWELTVTGSDLFAAGVVFVVLTKLAWGGWAPRSGRSLGAAALTIAAASARIAFGWVTACVSLLMWRKNRRGAALVLATTVAVAAAEAWFWLPGGATTPWAVISKIAGLLGASGVALAAAAAFASAGLVLTRLEDSIAGWWTGLWVLLAAPLSVVSLGVLMKLGWSIANWQAGSYLEAAVPAVVACVAADVTLPGSRGAVSIP